MDQYDIYPDADALMEQDAEQEAATADERPAFAPHTRYTLPITCNDDPFNQPTRC